MINRSFKAETQSLKSMIVKLMNGAPQPHVFEDMIKLIHTTMQYHGHEFYEKPILTVSDNTLFRSGESRARMEYRNIYRDRAELMSGPHPLRPDFILAKPTSGYRKMDKNIQREKALNPAFKRRRNNMLSITSKVEKMAALGLHRTMSTIS
jgi:hypothetical protein